MPRVQDKTLLVKLLPVPIIRPLSKSYKWFEQLLLRSEGFYCSVSYSDLKVSIIKSRTPIGRSVLLYLVLRSEGPYCYISYSDRKVRIVKSRTPICYQISESEHAIGMVHSIEELKLKI